jgi:regulator of nucleoside diphosphate kinase
MFAAMQPQLAALLTRHWASLHESTQFAVHDCEVHYLTAMALGACDDLAAHLLLRKLRMAQRVSGNAGRRFVRMNSLVEFVDDQGETRQARLTHPSASRLSPDGISITSLLGTGLLGLSEGQAIKWPDQTGEMHPLKVNRIGGSAMPIQFSISERKNHDTDNEYPSGGLCGQRPPRPARPLVPSLRGAEFGGRDHGPAER